MSFHLARLNLLHFRNHREVEAELGPEVNCFVGPNGVGKTNLLDAVHYLSMGKSYFDPVDIHNILHGEDVLHGARCHAHRGRRGAMCCAACAKVSGRS